MLTQYAVGPELEQKGCGGLRGLVGLCKNERKRSNKQKKKKKVLKGEFFRRQEGFGGSHLGEVSVYETPPSSVVVPASQACPSHFQLGNPRP